MAVSYIAYSVDDPDMPPAVRSICPGGANTTTITNSTMLGESGVRMTTGVCGPVEEDEDDSEPGRLLSFPLCCVLFS